MADELVFYGVESGRRGDVARVLLDNVDDPETDVKSRTGGFLAPQTAWDAVVKALGSDVAERDDDGNGDQADEKPKRRSTTRKATAADGS
jgi:hypothetical protein